MKICILLTYINFGRQSVLKVTEILRKNAFFSQKKNSLKEYRHRYWRLMLVTDVVDT